MMRKGFTIIELLIFIAIFAVTMVSFTTILLSITKIQTQQVSENEVNQQSQFLLQQLQYYVELSSNIYMPSDVATTTLTLRMANSSTDPTVISLSNGTLYIQQGTGSQQALTSPRVSVSSLTFEKHGNPPGHDSVDISFTLAYNTSNVVQAFSQLFQTSISRVSAASFDSNLIPSTTAFWNLGVTGNVWNSVNNIIYFSGSDVGIGNSSPQAVLDIGGGGMRIDPESSLSPPPACSATVDGEFWIVSGGTGVKDTVEVCVKNASNVYSWFGLY